MLEPLNAFEKYLDFLLSFVKCDCGSIFYTI